eukprot:9361380-Pyramimonas_sp.AAC.1
MRACFRHEVSRKAQLSDVRRSLRQTRKQLTEWKKKCFELRAEVKELKLHVWELKHGSVIRLGKHRSKARTRVP